MPLDAEIELVRRETDEMVGLLSGQDEIANLVRRSLGRPGKIYSAGLPRWPLLVLLVCESLGNRYHHAAAAAAALECFVLAGDILDDLEDGDVADAIDELGGPALALNVATILLMLSQAAVLRLRQRGVAESTVIRVIQAISSAGIEACAGQHRDLTADTNGLPPSETIYLQMIESKSGSLMECACRVGALLAVDDEAAISSFASFGRNLGIAAQLTNDIQTLEASRDRFREIRTRKITLPVIYGLANCEGSAQRLLRSVYCQKQEITSEIEQEAVAVLRRSGAVHYAMVVAEAHRIRATRAIQGQPVSARLKQFLDI